ncbi:phosphate ABC transporter permease PstA [Sessilibacter sp. MAH2]
MIDRAFSLGIYAIIALVIATFGWIIGDVIIKGISVVSWEFLISEPEDAGRAGGIAPILVSTLYVLIIALVIALPLGISAAIWLAEFSQNQSHTLHVGIILDVLAGVPSIVYGLFGNAFFCIYLGLGYSLLSGGLTLACMILPVFIRTCESGIRSVQSDWRLGGLALGMRRSVVIWKILLPAAKPAIIAGLILSIGRATAETAALLFTSGYVDRMPESIFDSARVLAVHIYDLTMNVTGGDETAYGSALILIVLIILLNTLAQGFIDSWFKRSGHYR